MGCFSEEILTFSCAVCSAQSLPEPTPDTPLMVKAVASFYSLDSRDLSFEVGDTVKVTGVDRATGWWIGTVDGVQYGLVPMNHLQFLPPGTELPLTPVSMYSTTSAAVEQTASITT